MNLASGRVTALLDDREGGVRDPVVHYDGGKVLFSYRKGGTPYYHLYEMDLDGGPPRQLTDGPYDDIEPCYLPDDSIVFVSSRCKRWVNCWVTKVAVLHRCDADGRNIRAISANVEHDNTPWPLPDGRVLYQRWEYVDRSQMDYHHLWTVNPDGTGQMVYYGNLFPGVVMIDAKSIPGSNKVVAIFSPGHGQREHDGTVTVLDASRGPDQRSLAHSITREATYRDPWAFSEEAFLAAQRNRLVLLDGQGRAHEIYRTSKEEAAAGLECHEPRPIVRRPREQVVPDRIDPKRKTGTLVLADVYRGRNMAGLQRGEIKKLLVLESLPKPINFTGGMDPLTYGGSFTLERVLGTVPVEADGSAALEVPAKRAVFFVALDQNDLAVKRMQSFVTVQPGEVTGCIGCHERRTETLMPPGSLQALRRRPSRIEPVADCPDVFDFPRDIQPILDKLCNDCHGCEKTARGGPYAGKLLLSGDRGPMFSHAYFTATVRRLFSDNRNEPKSNLPPRSLGSGASRILTMLDGSHYDVKADEHQQRMLRLWIDVGAPYPGTYAALGTGSIGGYSQNSLINTDTRWPTTQAGAEVDRPPLRVVPHGRQYPAAVALRRAGAFLLAVQHCRPAAETQPAHRLQPDAAREVADATRAAGREGRRMGSVPQRPEGTGRRLRRPQRPRLPEAPGDGRGRQGEPRRDQALRHARLPPPPAVSPRDAALRHSRPRYARRRPTRPLRPRPAVLGIAVVSAVRWRHTPLPLGWQLHCRPLITVGVEVVLPPRMV